MLFSVNYATPTASGALGSISADYGMTMTSKECFDYSTKKDWTYEFRGIGLGPFGDDSLGECIPMYKEDYSKQQIEDACLDDEAVAFWSELTAAEKSWCISKLPKDTIVEADFGDKYFEKAAKDFGKKTPKKKTAAKKTASKKPQTKITPAPAPPAVLAPMQAGGMSGTTIALLAGAAVLGVYLFTRGR